jgi:hypothetical protein
MDEAAWLACTDPTAMLAFLGARVGGRKLRLFAVAAYRHIGAWVADPASREAVAVAERFADGRADDAEREAAHAAAHHHYLNSFDDTFHAYAAADEDPAHAAAVAAQDLDSLQRSSHLALLLRDLVGNPWRPAVVAPAWRTETTVGIARAVYQAQAFDGLPILADALEDAGCDDANALDHLRSPGPHTRGCWVLDCILGKE